MRALNASISRFGSMAMALTAFTLSSASHSLMSMQAADPGNVSSQAIVIQPQPADSIPGVAGAAPLTPEQIGDLHMARRRYQAAIEAYRHAPQDSPAVWNKMGIARQQMFMMDEAKKSYEKSLRLDPNNPDVLNNLATIYYSMKQYSIAEKYYRKALKIRPASALIDKNLGTDLLAEDKFKKGWDCYQAALAIDPDIFERSSLLRIGEPTPTGKRGAMNFFLAKSYLRAGRTDLAVEYLRMAIDQGFTDRKRVMADKEFASLHGISAFEQLLSEQRAQ